MQLAMYFQIFFFFNSYLFQFFACDVGQYFDIDARKLIYQAQL